jgi:hypothetical protein
LLDSVIVLNRAKSGFLKGASLMPHFLRTRLEVTDIVKQPSLLRNGGVNCQNVHDIGQGILTEGKYQYGRPPCAN